MHEIRYVEWVDSTHGPMGWVETDYEITTLTCYSVGLVHAESDDRLVLAGDWHDGQHGRLVSIPKSAIVKSRTLRKAR